MKTCHYEHCCAVSSPDEGFTEQKEDNITQIVHRTCDHLSMSDASLGELKCQVVTAGKVYGNICLNQDQPALK